MRVSPTVRVATITRAGLVSSSIAFERRDGWNVELYLTWRRF